MEIVKKENMFGGTGYITIKSLLDQDQLNGKCRLFGETTIKPGNALGYHVHQGDAECYYILSGEGEYDDNGTKRLVKAGEVTYTPSGKGHGITNTGSEDLVFMALIIYD